MSGKIIPRVTVLRCIECGHKWLPRTENPWMCPRCHSQDWDGVKHPSPAQYRRQQKGVNPNFVQMRGRLQTGEFDQLKARLGR